MNTTKLVSLLLAASLGCFAFAGYIHYGRQLNAAQANTKTFTMPSIGPIKPSEASQAPTLAVTPKTTEIDVITLTDDNMVVLDQAFDDETVTAVMQDLQKLSDKSPKDATLYLVLNTPGGSVTAGQRLISFAKALPQKVKTLTLFAASMGFQTVQGLDERLILDTGTLMSHRARFGVDGETSQIESRLKYFLAMIEVLDRVAAGRMGITLASYRTLIHDEYWAFGQAAVAEKSADRMVLAKCGKGLNKSKTILVKTIFGNFNVELSKCPLMPGMLGYQPAKDSTPNAEATEYVKLMFNDKRQFVKEFIITNKFMEFQK
jgi:ATP-dependent Clp protease protease subunit